MKILFSTKQNLNLISLLKLNSGWKYSVVVATLVKMRMIVFELPKWFLYWGGSRIKDVIFCGYVIKFRHFSVHEHHMLVFLFPTFLVLIVLIFLLAFSNVILKFSCSTNLHPFSHFCCYDFMNTSIFWNLNMKYKVNIWKLISKI